MFWNIGLPNFNYWICQVEGIAININQFGTAPDTSNAKCFHSMFCDVVKVKL